MGSSMDKKWFRIKKLYPNIWGIGEFKHPEEVISYLIVGDNQGLLFDTGLGIENIYKVVKSITNLPIIVVNSHDHYDHIGGNKYFQKIVKLKNNSTLVIFPFKFLVIPTPGHTPDSICLYEINEKLLFSGDTIYPGPIYLHFKQSNFGNYKVSIKRLSELKLKAIFPGHNDFICPTQTLKLLDKKLSLMNPESIRRDIIVISKNLTLRFK